MIRKLDRSLYFSITKRQISFWQIETNNQEKTQNEIRVEQQSMNYLSGGFEVEPIWSCFSLRRKDFLYHFINHDYDKRKPPELNSVDG